MKKIFSILLLWLGITLGFAQQYPICLISVMNEKLQELGWEGQSSDAVNTPTEDGGEFYVKEMNGREWMEMLGNLGQNVWENAALPKSYWNKDEGYNQSNIHIPPTFAGVGDGVIEEVTEYPQLIKLGYDVSTEKEVRERLWESVKGISVETIKDASIDFYEEKKANYTSDKSYIVNHTVGKDAVQVASMLMGGGLAGGLKKGAKGVDDAVGKAGKEVLSKVSGELEDSADKLANKLVKEAVENGDLEKEIVESAKNEIKDISTKKGRKLSWEEVKDFFKRGNDFNRKVNSKVPPKYDFNEVTVEQIIDGKVRKFRLDGYNEGLEIVSRKATDFDNIKTSTFEKYCDELINKYKVGTKITAPKYPELNGKTLQGKY